MVNPPPNISVGFQEQIMQIRAMNMPMTSLGHLSIMKYLTRELLPGFKKCLHLLFQNLLSKNDEWLKKDDQHCKQVLLDLHQ